MFRKEFNDVFDYTKLSISELVEKIGYSRYWDLPNMLKLVLRKLNGNLDGKEDKANKGIPNGYAGLDSLGKVPSNQLPSDLVTSVNGQIGAVVITKADLGLSNVDNTSDANKPISAATQALLDLKEDKANKGIPNGYAGLDSLGKVPTTQLPALAITDTNVVATQAAMLAVTAEVGDVAIRTDLSKTFILTASPASNLANWQEVLSPTNGVTSINGQTGTIIFTKTDVGLSNVDNTSDINKPISAAQLAVNNNKVDKNAAITGATKTKITYDSKGLVTAGADATTADINPSPNRNYVTDANLVTLNNPSGSQTTIVGINGTKAQYNTSLTDGDFLFVGDIVPVSASQTGTVNNTSLQELGGVDKTINSVRVGRGGGNAASNTAIGSGALSANTTGVANTANGNNALVSNTTGGGNTAMGYASLTSNTTGSSNTANGSSTLTSNTEGSNNTATGVQALVTNTTGNGNTANGFSSLFSNTEGSNNTATGGSSLFSNTTGGSNTATGVNSLYSNTTGNNNTANGVSSLSSNTVGYDNTATGGSSLLSNTIGNNNTANGVNSLQLNTEGNNNTATGASSLQSNTTGGGNTATGVNSLQANTTGGANTAMGLSVLLANTTGNNNTATGIQSLSSNTIGSNNTATGANSLRGNSTGGANTANGVNVLNLNTTGEGNTATGANSLLSNTIGLQNVANGIAALQNNERGSYNVAVGAAALQNNGVGNNNTAIGDNALVNSTSNNNIAIGKSSAGGVITGSNNTYIGKGDLLLGDTSNTLVLSTGANTRIIVDSTGKTKLMGMLNIANVPTFADNALATTGGLIVGDVYRTMLGVLMIRF